MRRQCFVLKTDAPPAEAKKMARDLKKAQEQLYGKGSCSVVVIPTDSDICQLSENWDMDSEFPFTGGGCSCNDNEECSHCGSVGGEADMDPTEIA